MKNAKAVLFGLYLFASGAVTAVQAQTTLWYNGDFNHVSSLRDNFISGYMDATVYDNFTVTVTSGGWHISTVFGNIQFGDTNGVTTGNWCVRSGVSAGNGGTVVASGTDAPITLTPTGTIFYGNTEFKVAITGLNVTLAPGTYWLSVEPINSYSYISTTSGANAVGSPAADGNAYWNSPTQSIYYELQPAPPSGFSDYSMGIVGTEINAATLALAPVLSSTIFTNQQFWFTVSGTVGSNYVVQTTTDINPTNWVSLVTNAAPFIFTETNTHGALHRFYRGLLAP